MVGHLIERSTPAPGAASVRATVSVETTPREWDGFVGAHPDGTVDHLWRWRQIFDDVFGHQSTYLAARRGDMLVGVLPLVRFQSRLFGRCLISVPFLNYGGVLASDSETAGELIESARLVAQDFGAAYVELRHVARQSSDLPFRQHKLQLTRRLPATSEELWSRVDRKVRNQVRKAQKDGLCCEIGGSELLDAFYSVFSRNMRDLGTPVYAKRFFSETVRLFPSQARVYIVMSGRVPTAASIALRHGDTVLVPWASSRRDYRHQCPNMLLYWTMLADAITCGAGVFDFGRSSRNTGPHQFKRQWGAEETPLHWEYVLLTRSTAPDTSPSNGNFVAAIKAWQRMPLWLANAIGPSVVRNIP